VYLKYAFRGYFTVFIVVEVNNLLERELIDGHIFSIIFMIYIFSSVFREHQHVRPKMNHYLVIIQ
jgi:hypothetical protein